MVVRLSTTRMDMESIPIQNIEYQDINQITAPAAPSAASKVRLYAKTDGKLYIKPTGGSEEAVGAGVAAGIIAFYNGTTAPSGWTELTAARGRTIVGLPASGTLAGTVGTALTDVLNRTHTHTGPSHQHLMARRAGGPGAPFHASATGAPYGSSGTFTENSYVDDPDTAGGGAVANWLNSSAGTGATGTAATSDVIAYIQYLAVSKD